MKKYKQHYHKEKRGKDLSAFIIPVSVLIFLASLMLYVVFANPSQTSEINIPAVVADSKQQTGFVVVKVERFRPFLVVSIYNDLFLTPPCFRHVTLCLAIQEQCNQSD